MTITHAAWKFSMGGAITVLGELARRQDTRIADLQGRGAGPEHLALLRGIYASRAETAAIGQQVVTVEDDVHIPVGEAFHAAGGEAWIAQAKEFISDS